MIAIAPPHKNQLVNYTSWLEKRNFEYKILNENDNIQNFSMLMLCGGPDIGENNERDNREFSLFEQSYGKIPILGICRGLQLANVKLGGTLFEDLSEDLVKHTTNKVEIAGEPAPTLESSWHLIEFIDGKKLKVNSRHHQGILNLGQGLITVAVCENDKLPEMVIGNKSLFVQWHPERLDVWNTEAEIIVSDWISQYETKTETVISSLDKIVKYINSKGFSVISNDRVRKSIDSSLTDRAIKQLIVENSSILKYVKDKNGNDAIKLLKC